MTIKESFVITHRQAHLQTILYVAIEVYEVRVDVVQQRLPRCSPSTTARPPQNGSTYRRSAFASQIGFSCETSQRLPPAHFKGGLNITLPPKQIAGAGA